ncbi:hypothetical protein ACFPRL_25880 [Pseudoclavibacter helvolus]
MATTRTNVMRVCFFGRALPSRRSTYSVSLTRNVRPGRWGVWRSGKTPRATCSSSSSPSASVPTGSDWPSLVPTALMLTVSVMTTYCSLMLILQCSAGSVIPIPHGTSRGTASASAARPIYRRVKRAGSALRLSLTLRVERSDKLLDSRGDDLAAVLGGGCDGPVGGE